MSGRPRSNSMTDAFRLRQDYRSIPREDNPILTYAARTQAAHSRNAEFVTSLPRLTEQDIATLQLSDSSCPICIVPFSAILSEEETAGAMDSPAYAAEELGVTKLEQTCGHVFCRKDIQNWLLAGHNSCPTCRRPLVLVTPDVSEAPTRLSDLLRVTQESIQSIEMLQDHISLNLLQMRAQDEDEAALFSRLAHSEPDQNHTPDDDADDDNRAHLSGMYS